MAAAMYDGDILPRQFEKDRIFDPEIRGFAERVIVCENKELEQYTGKWPARIVIKLKDGTVLEKVTIDWTDGSNRKEFVEKKFLRLASSVGKAGKAASIVRAVDTLEKAEDIIGLIGTICE